MTKAVKPKGERPSPRRPSARSASALPRGEATGDGRRVLAAEAEETLNAIRAGQIDALVIQDESNERLFAIRSFAEIEESRQALDHAGAAQKRSDAQLRSFADERERLFQDLHDGCIQSIYAVGINLQACLRLIDADPQKAEQMIADATASLNLVIQELRAVITGRELEIPGGRDLRSEIESATRSAANRALDFSVDIDETAMRALTSEQALHFLQIAREGISNTIRHANARTGRVSLQPGKKGAIVLQVSDDGTGFVAANTGKLGLGLHHIRARARKMGGTARISSAPGKGTRIVVEIRRPR